MKRFVVLVIVTVFVVCTLGTCCFAATAAPTSTPNPTLKPYSTLDPGLVNASNIVNSQWIISDHFADYIQRGDTAVTFRVSDPEHILPDHVYDHVKAFFNSSDNSLDIYYWYQDYNTDHERVARYFYSTRTYEFKRLARCIVTVLDIGTAASPANARDFQGEELRAALDPVSLFSLCYSLVYLPGSGMGTVLDGAQTTFFNFLVIGEGLITFVTNNWIILIPLIAWVMIAGIGVVFRIVKKRG